MLTRPYFKHPKNDPSKNPLMESEVLKCELFFCVLAYKNMSSLEHYYFQVGTHNLLNHLPQPACR